MSTVLNGCTRVSSFAEHSDRQRVPYWVENDGLTEIGAQHCPGRRPAITLDQTSQRHAARGLATAHRPGHARALHTHPPPNSSLATPGRGWVVRCPLRDQRLAGGFDDPTGDRQAAPETRTRPARGASVLRVVHAGSLIPKVSQFSVQPFAFVSAGATALILENPNDLVRPVVGFLEQGLQTFEFGFAPRAALTPGGVTAILQMITGMVEIDDLQTGLGWNRQGALDVGQQAPVVFRATPAYTAGAGPPAVRGSSPVAGPQYWPLRPAIAAAN